MEYETDDDAVADVIHPLAKVMPSAIPAICRNCKGRNVFMKWVGE